MNWMTRTRDFVGEVKVEATKVSWPTRLEIRDSTVVVIVTVIIVMIYIFIIDRILTLGLGLFFQR